MKVVAGIIINPATNLVPKFAKLEAKIDNKLEKMSPTIVEIQEAVWYTEEEITTLELESTETDNQQTEW